ncbi:MAG: 3-keto-5-aminohexanoate cleavage protein [Candidatus Bathyarchaeota archaeon]|nr:3-keto-5-aminohexanoate cleavage protein [Candidatus Bathyarchaeota archaeon]
MVKLIITAAVTGGEPVSREMTPYVPTTAEEITEETVRCWEAGASIVHLHAKEPGTGKPAPDPNPLLKQYVEMIHDRCDIITNVTTGGGRRATDEELDKMIEERCGLGQEMMSMNMGTINLWIKPYRGIFVNDVPRIIRWAGYMRDHDVKPELEIYDTGMINTSKMLADEGVFETPLHIQFVMVGRTGFSATPKALLYSLEELPGDWTWSVCALGRAELPIGAVAMTLGGHVRVGMEDNIMLKRGELLKSNAQLVERIVTIAEALNIEVAKPDEARKILGIKK